MSLPVRDTFGTVSPNEHVEIARAIAAAKGKTLAELIGLPFFFNALSKNVLVHEDGYYQYLTTLDRITLPTPPTEESANVAARIDLDIVQGSTFSKVYRWAQPKLAYRTIEAATQAAPCVLTTDAPHGLPEGWSFLITDAAGMVELNARNELPDVQDRYYQATVLGPDQVELNDVNASGFGAYTGGGVITYNVPVDLAGYTARAKFKTNKAATTALLSLTTENGRIVLDNATKTITLQITAEDTAEIDWTTAVYDLELVSGGGIVYPVAYGDIAVELEVTD